MSGIDAQVEFLKARLDEDEAAASGVRTWTDRDWTTSLDERGDGWVMADGADPIVVTIGHVDAQASAVVEHIARWDPARVLAEVVAKRAILAQYERSLMTRREHPTDLASSGALLALLGTVRRLAQVYADHPNFDPAWGLS